MRTQGEYISTMQNPNLEHFQFTVNTGENATIIMPTTSNPQYSDGATLSIGDEIGVLTSEGLCCGATVWSGQNTAITVWGDNSQTQETDGFTAGDGYHFRVWKKSANIEYQATIQFQPVHPTPYGTNNYSVLNSFIADLNTYADYASNIEIPSEFKLYANYPNPFNPETTIRYNLPKSSHVVLSIYNLMGQEVIRLVDEFTEAGYHTTYWGGKNDRGEQVTSGVYIYRINISEFQQSKKLVFNR